MNISVIIPTYNAGDIWPACIKALKEQTLNLSSIDVIDSGSEDGTVSSAREAGFSATIIDKQDFDHGLTRQGAVEAHGDDDILIFLTQDAVLSSSKALESLVRVFEDKDVAAACGRQLPREGATAIESHARLFNYPSQSNIKSLSSKTSKNIKTIFLSNSFAAYRVSALRKVGGFTETIFGEDMLIAARLLKAGFRTAYVAEACVYHSHDYSMRDELKRYFDIGVFHSRNDWLMEEFGRAEGEGIRFVMSEMNYLLKNNVLRIPESLMRTILKYSGYRFGLFESSLPAWFKTHLSMNPTYFSREASNAER